MNVVAELRSSIPFPVEKVRQNAPIRWDMGTIQMVTPLFSLYRYNMFVRACQLFPIVMIQKEIQSFWEFIDIPKDMKDTRDLAEEINTNLRYWKEEKIFESAVDDMYALLIAISDPLEPEIALEILTDWNADNGGWLPFPDEPLTNPIQMRQLLYDYALHNLDITSASLLIGQIKQLNTEFKKKLNIFLQITVEESLSPRRKQLLHLLKRNTEKPVKKQ